MTEYKEEVARQREKLKLEKWAEQCKYIHANGGVIETAFNNGDIKYEYTRGLKRGQIEWHREKASKDTLLDKFGRYLADNRILR
jgi:hypothetical protein